MYPQMCNNVSQCALIMPKVGNIRARDPNEGGGGVVESPANKGASDALGPIKCETGSSVRLGQV